MAEARDQQATMRVMTRGQQQASGMVFQPPRARAQAATTAGFAFFLLVIFTALVLLRPQDMFPGLGAARPIAVLSVFIPLLAFALVRPILWQVQHTLMLFLVPFIMLSGTLNGWMGGGVFRGLDFLNGSVIPLVIFSFLLTTGSRQKVIMAVFIIAALLMVHNGHVQQHSADGFGWAGIDAIQDGRIRYVGILQDPNDLGMLFMITLPFVLYFYSESGALGKLFNLLVVCALVYGVYMTDSRGTIVGLVGLTSLFLLLRYGSTKAIIAGLILAPIFVGVAGAFREVSAAEASAKGRLWAWWDGLEMLRANPVFGVGSGNFIEHHDRVAHNTYIQVVAELGLVGYLMWITAVFLTMLMGYYCVLKLRFATRDQLSPKLIAELKLSATCFYSLAAFSMTAFFLSRDRFIVLYILLGMAIAAYLRVVKINGGEPLFDIRRAMPRIAVGAAAVILFTYGILKVTL